MEISHFHDAPLHQFEHQTKLPVDFGMFFFAWANAGVKVEGAGAMTVLILTSLLAGKVLGIMFMSQVRTDISLSLVGKNARPLTWR